MAFSYRFILGFFLMLVLTLAADLEAQPSRVFNGQTYTQGQINTAAQSLTQEAVEGLIRTRLLSSYALSNNQSPPVQGPGGSGEESGSSNPKLFTFTFALLDGRKVTLTENSSSTVSYSFSTEKTTYLASFNDGIVTFPSEEKGGGYNFCHRKKGETSSACNDREYDEFTDDWAGFIAYWSHPAIPVMIGIMCRCDE